MHRWVACCRLQQQGCRTARKKTPYVTLRYTWGPSSSGTGILSSGARLQPITPSRRRHGSGSRPSRLPASMGGPALHPSRRQGSEALENTRHGEEYANSALTIISASGDVDYSLSGVGPHLRGKQPCIRLGAYCPVTYPESSDEMESSEWSRRGWAYQGTLLLARWLVFIHRQVYSQCQTTHFVEDLCVSLQDVPESSIFGPVFSLRQNTALVQTLCGFRYAIS